MTNGAGASNETCSLDDPQVADVLERLHAAAKGQWLEFVVPGLGMVFDWLLGREATVAEEAERMKKLYIPLSPEQGRLAYLVARSLGARRIVEFGTSLGISTIYLAAAVRDNGGGLVIGSEIHPEKIVRARAHIAEAGLADYVEVREGDAQETLADPGGTVDMALLDGWKHLYLPIIKMLTPHLRPGAVVLGDNINTFKKTLTPYVEHVSDTANGFQSVTLSVADGTAYSVKL